MEAYLQFGDGLGPFVTENACVPMIANSFEARGKPMSRTFNDSLHSRAEREAIYRRNARITRERDRFPFSNFDVRKFQQRQKFDAWLDSLPRDSFGNPIVSRG